LLYNPHEGHEGGEKKKAYGERKEKKKGFL
jgi:hypothetical protein